MARKSRLRSRTFLPRSKTTGLYPSSIQRKAAYIPAGPKPTICILGFEDTSW